MNVIEKLIREYQQRILALQQEQQTLRAQLHELQKG